MHFPGAVVVASHDRFFTAKILTRYLNFETDAAQPWCIEVRAAYPVRIPVSRYIAELRELIGSRLLVLPAVTAIIRDETGRYLVACHLAGDRWVLVGGAVEPMEDPRDALARKVREELGVWCDVLEVLDSYGGHEPASE